MYKQQYMQVQGSHNVLKWNEEHGDVDRATRDVHKAECRFLVGPLTTQRACPKVCLEVIEAQGELKTHCPLPTEAQRYEVNAQEIQRQSFVAR